MAIVLLHNMRTMKELAAGQDRAESSGAAAEVRTMTRLYLSSKLADR